MNRAEATKAFEEFAKHSKRKVELRLVSSPNARIDARCRFCQRTASVVIGEPDDENDRRLYAFLLAVLEQHAQCGPS